MGDEYIGPGSRKSDFDRGGETELEMEAEDKRL